VRSAAFYTWLIERGYRHNTATKTVSDLKSFLKNPFLAQQPASQQRAYDYRRAWTRYAEFVEAMGAPPLVVRPPPEPTALPRHLARRERRRKLPAESIPEEQWHMLVAAVKRAQTPQARVLEVLSQTALRIGDVLRIDRDQLRRALRGVNLRIEVKGGKEIVHSTDSAPEAWQSLYACMMRSKGCTNVASLCAKGDNPEADGPAYKSVVRLLHRLGESAGVEGRIHVHRMRRTVAVMMLKRGVPIEHIQRVLGHASLAMTERYLNEAMPDLVTKALSKLRED